MEELNKIDLISAGPAGASALLHLIVEGGWEDTGTKREILIKRLSIYNAFVTTGQLAAIRDYQYSAPKILVHFESKPPDEILFELGEMRTDLRTRGIELGITIGPDVTDELWF